MEMDLSSWAESRLLLAKHYGDNTDNNILWSHTETNSLLHDLMTVWLFAEWYVWSCFGAKAASKVYRKKVFQIWSEDKSDMPALWTKPVSCEDVHSYPIMILSPVTNEPVYLWNVPNRCLWSIPKLSQSFAAPVPTCCLEKCSAWCFT